MDESDTLGIGESDDINLPLDEIIQRKAQRERGTPNRRGRRGSSRRYGQNRRNFIRQTPPGFRGSYGTGAFHGDLQLETPWPGYDEGMAFQNPVPTMEAPYWQLYPQPPPPPHLEAPIEERRTKYPVSFIHDKALIGGKGLPQGGIRKPVSNRQRNFGGRKQHREPMPHPSDLPLHMEQPYPKEVQYEDLKELHINPILQEKCKMTFDKGLATITFRDVEILKVSLHSLKREGCF